MLSNSPAEVVRAVLLKLALADDPTVLPLDPEGWPCYVEGEPSSPDNVVTVYDTAGQDDGRSMIDGDLFAHFGFQIRVRATDHQTGWHRADLIRDGLAKGVYGMTVMTGAPVMNPYVVHCFAKVGQVLPLGKETPSSKRSLFTLNALVAVREITVG